MRVHILAHLAQRILQLAQIHADHLIKEAREEDRVASLVHLLRGDEEAHLLFRHGHDIGTQRIGDAGLTLEEGGKSIDAHHMLIMRHLLPLLAVNSKVDLRGFPLLLFPTVVQFAIAGQVDQALVDNPQHVVDWRLL